MGQNFIVEDYDCVVRRDNSSWVAEYPDIPGVSAAADNKLDALSAAEDILTLWLANARDLGMEIPAPGDSRSASGEFKVRLPRTLHARLATAAGRCGLSLNDLTTRFLTAAVASVLVPAQTSGGFQCDRLPMSEPMAASGGRDYSGTWIQRTPRVLHLHLQRLAEAEGTSMNALVVYLLGYELGGFEAHARMSRSLERRDAA